MLLGSLIGSSVAYADNTTLHFTAAGSVAATDNVFASAVNTESDVFFQIRPGILLSHDGPRLIQIYTAEAEVLEYAEHNPSQPSLTYRAGWKGNFLYSPLVDIIGVANVSTGQINQLVARGTADQAVVAISPAGTTTANQADATELLTKRLDQTYALRQGLSAHYGTTEDQVNDTTSSVDADLTLGIERDSLTNSFLLQFDLEYVRLRRVDPDPVPPVFPPIPNPAGNRQDQQVNPRASLLWRHDFSRYWSSSTNVGVVTLNPVGIDPFNPTDTHRPASLFAVGGAALNYTDLWGRASVAVSRNVAPDLLLAESTLTTNAIATLALPLPWFNDPNRLSPRVNVAGTIGVLQSEVLPTENGIMLDQGTFTAFHASLGVLYAPHPNQTYGLRYDYIYQTGDAAALKLLPAFSTNTVFFTFTFRYPERLAVDLRSVRGDGQSTRADRTDVVPLDDEPPKDDSSDSNGVTGAKHDDN